MSEKMNSGEHRKRGTVTPSRKYVRVRAGQTYISRVKGTDSGSGHNTESDTLLCP